MGDINPLDTESILTHLRELAETENLRVTVHAQQEMAAEDISVEDILNLICDGQIIENYPTHRHGPYGLLVGKTIDGRNLHVVCTTTAPTLIIITAYIPLPPRWTSPTERGDQ